MVKVPSANVTALYSNTTAGTPASPTIMDAAISDIVATIDANDDERINGLSAHQSASTLDHPNGSVTADKLATDSVETAKIKDSNVTTAKLADGSVTTAKLADDSVTTGKIAAGAVGTTDIADGAITAAKVADGTLTAAKFVSGALTNETENGLRITELDAQLAQKANQTDVDTALALKANQTDVSNQLLTKRSTSTKLTMEDMSAEVVSAMTGGATVSINSVPQDNSVNSKKTIYKSLNVDRISDLSFEFTGDEVYEKSSVTSDPLYYGLVYDTNGLGLSSGQTITFSFDLIIDDANAIALFAKCFQNNDPTLGTITGGVLDLNENGRVSIIQKGINNFTCTMTNTYNAAYRYVKPFACVDLTDRTKFATYYITNYVCLVGSTPLTYVTKGLFSISSGSIITAVSNINFDWQLVKQSDISTLGTTKWTGLKANFLGDSITQGLYYNGSSYVTATTPWHQHLKNLLGLAVARNYGVSGTHISGAYTVTDGSSNPAQSFVSRYSSMDNDADLIVVFGGTNDFGHSQTAPFGTMADRTDVSFYGGLHVLMSGLVNKYLGNTIVFMTPLHRSGDATPNSKGKVLKDYVNAIKEVAEYYGIYVLDTYATSGLTTQVSAVQTTYMNDGLHPNEAGHSYLGNRIAPFFETI